MGAANARPQLLACTVGREAAQGAKINKQDS